MNAELIHAAPLALILVWEDGCLSSLDLRWSASPGLELETPDPSRYALDLKRRLQAYVSGKGADWADLPEGSFESAGLSDFAQAVLNVLREKVSPGQTVTYGELAAMAGRPGAARAVGRIMAKNPWPIVYPCHRVLGAGGKLTGFGGCGLPMKEYLLRLEGAIS